MKTIKKAETSQTKMDKPVEEEGFSFGRDNMESYPIQCANDKDEKLKENITFMKIPICA